MLTSILLIFFTLTIGVAAEAQAEEQLWFRNGQVMPQAAQVLDAIRSAEARGLRPADYDLGLTAGEIGAVLDGRADSRMQQRFEAALSAAASRFISDLHGGRIDPRLAGFQLPPARREFDVAQGLGQLAASRNVAVTLDAFEPTPLPYKRLKQALGQYRALAKQQALTRLPPRAVRSIRPGDDYAGSAQLRRLLIALGDLGSESSAKEVDGDVIDPALAAALQRFQRRHGLEPDAVIGPRTFAALTTPLAQRVRQLELSMERWRWLTAIERPDIVVNIPQFALFALARADEPDAEVIEMRVIVGQSYPHTRTPMFTTEITQVVFQPYWDVPAGILERELLPRIRQDPTFLDRYHMEIVRGQGDDARVLAATSAAISGLAHGSLRLRQRPGPLNALGPVKFVMPNPYQVYLHATPEQALFERLQRTFSHGCIRVSDPTALSAYVLRGAREKWSDAAIESALCGTQTLRVPLQRPVKVVVFYSTAVASRSAGVLFFPDVYDHDRELRQLLERPTESGSRSPERA